MPKKRQKNRTRKLPNVKNQLLPQVNKESQINPLPKSTIYIFFLPLIALQTSNNPRVVFPHLNQLSRLYFSHAKAKTKERFFFFSFSIKNPYIKHQFFGLRFSWVLILKSTCSLHLCSIALLLPRFHRHTLYFTQVCLCI